MASMIHVYVVDRQPVFCTGIQAILEETTDLQLLGTATSLEQHDSWAANKPPDVLLLAANMSHDSLLETISTWKQEYEDSKTLVMLSYADEVCLRQLTDQGADGCILKTDTPQRFIQAIRSVAEGENWFSRTVMEETLQTQILSTQETSSMQLTEQDKLILRLICAEKSNHEIAAALHVSGRTVCRYLEDIYIKLEVGSRLGAAIQAVKLELA